MGCAGLAVVFFPRFFLRGILNGFWEPCIEVMGFSLIFFGQIIRVSGRGYKAEHSRDSRALIQGGPYQLVRNPMYLGIFLIGLGVVLVLFKWWVVVIFIIVFIIRYLLLIYQEEAKLRGMFPGTYQEYCQKVPRILPSLLRLLKLKITEYLPLKLSWFYREIGSIFTLILLVFLVESWKNISEEGFKAYLSQSLWVSLTFIIFIIFVVSLSKRTSKRDENSANKS